MAGWARFYASHGLVVVTIACPNTWINWPASRASALIAAVKQLRAEANPPTVTITFALYMPLHQINFHVLLPCSIPFNDRYSVGTVRPSSHPNPSIESNPNRHPRALGRGLWCSANWI